MDLSYKRPSVEAEQNVGGGVVVVDALSAPEVRGPVSSSGQQTNGQW